MDQVAGLVCSVCVRWRWLPVNLGDSLLDIILVNIMAKFISKISAQMQVYIARLLASLVARQ